MADAIAKGKKPPPTPPRTGEDAFVQATVRLWKWTQQNLTAVIVGVVGVAMVLGGAWYYVNFQASVREQAATDLARLRATAAAPEALVGDLEAYIQRYDGTPSADEARLVLARMYLDSGRTEDAIAIVQAVSEPADQPIGFAARQLLAAAQEAAGDKGAALATWQELGREARFDFQRRQAEASAARILVDLGRLEEAAVILERIAAEAADDPSEAGVYRIRLGEIKARLAAGS